jgi:hypothetical protein
MHSPTQLQQHRRYLVTPESGRKIKMAKVKI